MSKSLHIVCPHCQTTNRVRADQLASVKNWGQTPINRLALLIQELFAHGLIGLRLLLML